MTRKESHKTVKDDLELITPELNSRFFSDSDIEVELKSVKTPTDPNSPVSFSKFQSSYKTLSLVSGVLLALTFINFILIFVMAWAVGNQFNIRTSNSFGNKLIGTEAKVDAVIEALPPSYRPKLNIKVIAPDKNIDRWFGNKDNRYVLIEYSDFECPFCRAAHPEIMSFIGDNSNDLSLIFRNLPLTSIHDNAQKLAQTGECIASVNGESAFWNFADRVYDDTIPLTVSGEEELGKYVENPSLIVNCVNSGNADEKIKRDVADAVSATVDGTPSFILYDMQSGKTKFVRNPESKADLQTIFDDFKK